jgi:hypothetical protein
MGVVNPGSCSGVVILGLAEFTINSWLGVEDSSQKSEGGVDEIFSFSCASERRNQFYMRMQDNVDCLVK